MRIENNLLYGNDYEPCDIMIEPANYHYSEFKRHLSDEQQLQAEKEKTMLQTFIAISDVKKMFSMNESNHLSINENVAVIERVKTQLLEKNLPLSLLDNTYITNFDNYPELSMKPNKDFPLTSVWTLANAKNYAIYTNSKEGQQYWRLTEKLQDKFRSLNTCKDADFVAQQIAPLQKEVADFEKNNKEAMKTIQKNCDIFDSYLETIGLKEAFYDFENSTYVKAPVVATNTKKRKP